MTDVLTGTTATCDRLTGATTLQFKEVPIVSTLEFTGSGTPASPNVGDIQSYTANLFDSNNVFVGTKDINNIFVRELKNGDIIGNLHEIYHLSSGEIFTDGIFNETKFLGALKPITTNIIGGTNTYSNVYGQETIINLATNTAGEVSTSLHFHL
ncbi:MAG: hypothetical protein V7K40_32660 [Nostoc sp.]|uniref:allene oxide cyclase barrel-like domain-containing protein n=1 Tax=Nostoc sp. TaxID=1180 RepID=UPI002FF99708